MINSDTVVAGVPSKRLSQLASPQILPRHRRECPIADHSALKDGITDVMRPNIDYSNEKSRNPTPRPAESEGFAGKSTCRINDSIYNHGSKKKSPNANKSAQMTDLFSSAGLRPEVPYRGTRSLKQYFSPDQLSEAFCTKFHVTDPLSGRTEIMTARRPGRASAEVNVADFDAYVLRQERAHSIKKAKDSIDHTVLVSRKSRNLLNAPRLVRLADSKVARSLLPTIPPLDYDNPLDVGTGSSQSC